jgi:hypothetical protein
MTGFEMHRGKLQGFVAAWLAALLVAGCSGAVDEPEVADIEALDAATEEDTGPPADTEVPDDTEVAGEDVGADDPTETTEPADDATETADGDPYAIPEDGIDEAYVERVLNAIFAVAQEATQLALDSPNSFVPVEAERLLETVYAREYGTTQYLALAQLTEARDIRSSLRNPVGQARTTVTEILTANHSCVAVRREADFSDVLKEASSPREDFLVLQRKTQADDPSSANPTPWVIVAGAQEQEMVSC